MKLKNTIMITAATFALTACSGLGLNGEDQIERPYKDIDGSVKFISFTKMETAYGSNDKKSVQGRAIKSNGDILGYIYYIFDANGQAMNTLFLKNQASLNPHNIEDMQKLAKAKIFNFYEFGKGRLAHAQYIAKNSLCSDFKSQNGIQLNIATNYYLDFTNYYTSFISAKISKNSQPTGLSYRPDFTVSDPKILAQIQAQEQSNGQKLAESNLFEKISVLTNIVCR
ncbi:hypothetical protein EDC44_11142 [Cricetibacter osteomyelitidis]|uniref:DUF8095 domain-containing protein n=1 Tax=Cricetibacter osteomyelitidis TaxID=1521931 RepID=A0A4R2TJT5_9PAST|nr:hypothetical protein [Cricetibacter osteomyelitidis]TCP95092.1 hypothetical protein EDC44_11142 [Cricetibacter osteomyelitidis]